MRMNLSSLKGGEVGRSIPDCEISSLLDKNIVRWSTVSSALALACPPFVLKYNKMYLSAFQHKNLNASRFVFHSSQMTWTKLVDFHVSIN